MTDQFSIENMKEELARASIKADEDAKTIAELVQALTNAAAVIHANGYSTTIIDELLTNNKIDHPLLLQDEAG